MFENKQGFNFRLYRKNPSVSWIGINERHLIFVTCIRDNVREGPQRSVKISSKEEWIESEA